MLNISVARKRCGITQNELAIKLGVTQGAVSQWEKGLSNPNIEYLPKLAQILECSVDDLLKAPAVENHEPS